MKKSKSQSISKAEEKTERRNRRRSKRKPVKSKINQPSVMKDEVVENEVNEEFVEFLDRPKCVSGFAKIYCSLLFKNNQAVGEGVIINGKEFIVLKNRKNRVFELLKARMDLANNVLSMPEANPLIAGEGILLPKVLEELEKKGIYKVKIILFKEEGIQKTFLSKYTVDTSYYRRFETKSYELSYKEFLNSASVGVFDSLLGKVIVKEE